MLGRTVNRYRVVARLGEGGMGTVWQAEDLELGRQVALKFLPRSLVDSPEARRRLMREAHAASRLEHPGIATLYNVEEFESELFLVYAYVDGAPVSRLVEEGPLPIAEALRIACAALDALDHAHAREVIHRDVTSGNIIVTRDRRVVLIDFGLALRPDTSRITSSGTTLGTLSYLAPEALRGEVVDHRADLYGLGVVLYEMLTGTVPFSARQSAALLYSAAHEDPEPPSARREGVSTVLDRLVLKALVKDPALRYATATEFAHALRSFLAGGEPAVATGSVMAPAGSAWKPVTRPVSLPANLRLAIQPFRYVGPDTESPDRALAWGLAETLSAALSRMPDLQVIPPSAWAATSKDEGGARTIAKELGANLVLVGTLQRSGEQLRASYSLLEGETGTQLAGDMLEGRATDLFLFQDQLLDSAIRALQLKAARTRSGQALHPASHQKYLRALGCLLRTDDPGMVDEAIRLLEELVASEGESAVVQTALAKAHLHRFMLTSEPESERRARESCSVVLRLDPHSSDVLTLLGRVRLQGGRYAEAVAAFQQALEVRRNNHEAYQYLSTAYEGLGEFEKAEEACRRAIALRPEYWGGHQRLGLLLYRQGKYDQAALAWRIVTELSPDNLLGHTNLAAALFELGRLDEAEASCRRSIEIRPTASALTGLGTVLFFRGDREGAVGPFEEAVRMRPNDPRMWSNLADAQRWSQAMKTQSEESFEKAVELMRDHLRVNPEDAEGWNLLALCLGKLSRSDESVHAIRRALELSPESAMSIHRAVVVYHMAGDRSSALVWLARALERECKVVGLKQDPELEGLREDPRAQALFGHGGASKTGTSDSI